MQLSKSSAIPAVVARSKLYFESFRGSVSGFWTFRLFVFMNTSCWVPTLFHVHIFYSFQFLLSWAVFCLLFTFFCVKFCIFDFMDFVRKCFLIFRFDVPLQYHFTYCHLTYIELHLRPLQCKIKASIKYQTANSYVLCSKPTTRKGIYSIYSIHSATQDSNCYTGRHT